MTMRWLACMQGRLGMFADWIIEPEELKNVLIRARNFMGDKWEEAFKT